jgi:RHS repeat-associated protein
MWQTTNSTTEWLQSKHIYLGEDRIATKFNSEGNPNTLAEERRVYYYHTDHLGSAQTITNYMGALHERLEYTPYGELWIDWQSNDAIDSTPFRFTGKERDRETGLYYFGARYLDPKTSRWLSADPAMSEYVPVSGQNVSHLSGMGGVYNTINLHTYHYSFNNPVRYIDPNGRSGDEPWTVSEQLNYLREYLSDTVNMSPQEKADAAAILRDDINNSGRYDIDGLMTGVDGNEQFMNEDLRDFLNTSDTGLPYTHEDMRGKDWSWDFIGDREHQNNTGSERNRKYKNTDGREAVFMKVGKNWVLSNDALDKGTFNYSLSGFLPGSKHGRWDMSPYYRQFNMSRNGYTSQNPRIDYNRNGRHNGMHYGP